MLADGSLNVSLVAKAIKTIQAGAALGKVVVVGLWPGPLVRFGPDGNPLWPEGSGATPRTPAEWRAALFHYVIGAFFCAVPITFACWLTLQTPKDIKLFWAAAWSLTPSGAAVAAAYFFVMPALDIIRRCL